MKKIKFAIVGSGWRSLFFVRITKALPEQFVLTHMLFRSSEKAESFAKKYNISVTTNKTDILNSGVDFVVIAVDKPSISLVAQEYIKEGLAVLTETPPANTIEGLKNLWELKEKYNGKIQVAEQYFLYPSFNAKLKAVRSGLLGKVENISISCVHDYHAVSLIRLFLQTGFQPVKIYGKKHVFHVTDTDSRYGFIPNGDVKERERVRLTIEFENGKTAFYDFSGVQYHSFIRTTHLNLQGTRGELDDNTIRYLNEKNKPIEANFCRLISSVEPEVSAITLGNETLYTNPFPGTRLSDDEIAIASCMLNMMKYIKTGEEVYSFRDAIQDAYISLLMEEAVKTPNQTISSLDIPFIS